MQQLFTNFNIKDKQNQIMEPPIPISVLTPYGFKNIVTMFRTQRQKTCRVYCTNNKTIQVGVTHRFKINGQ